MIHTHILGFPRIGHQRELKFALERYWRGGSSQNALEDIGRELRARHWALQRDAGLAWVNVGDFAYYDHVANHIQMLGCEPARFGFLTEEPELHRYFTLARGVAAETGIPVPGQPALEMTKWFDTNYHYLVPEFAPETTFRLASQRLFTELSEARALGHRTKVVLLGPLSFLWLGKEKTAGFQRLSLLPQLIPVYEEILRRLKAEGADWIQMDEPILGLDLPAAWQSAFEPAYAVFASTGVSLMLATYFSPLKENLALTCRLPVSALHVDGIRAGDELAQVAEALPDHRVLSAGIIDGRNIWRTDLDQALARLKPLLQRRHGTLWLAPSCSLLHVPISLAQETTLDSELRSWLAFAQEKLAELNALAQALRAGEESVVAQLDTSRRALASRQSSPRVHNSAVAARLSALPENADHRHSAFGVRQPLQRQRFKLPLFPTTTIGSFPQTGAIRATRAAHRRGALDDTQYRLAMASEIALTVRHQEALGLDVLVHGEAERNDMVEYFGEQLEGFAFSAQGWVQSYGSRCVKPPIIFGDVFRRTPITVEWTRYAQSLTQKPMKGMLTGPITLLQWSFVRTDQPRSHTALQIALAVRDEVHDLEQAGIGIIQIDEPALREGLPLHRDQWHDYLQWACRAFRIASSGVADTTQIHTHMCYSEFNDILPDIAALDADVITIETSRSDMTLLHGFGHFHYPNEIGPGVYDIHSPRVPSTEEMVRLLEKAAAVIPANHLWVNPDCGLKTRGWPETLEALSRMVAAALQMREKTTISGVN
ncbi:MAG: 5-methyltetrahydropteroyltriglutamate--homocysteine S-methyltransferase [Betaproteobacteria bacterium]|nr:5-methyltetrahydropteroyltriglutamate--homocysteine S-methyltransferase [Betaproteobacteria bacterium]